MAKIKLYFLTFAACFGVCCNQSSITNNKREDSKVIAEARPVVKELLDSIILDEEHLLVELTWLSEAFLITGNEYNGYANIQEALKKEVIELNNKITKNRMVLTGGSWTLIKQWPVKSNAKFTLAFPVDKENQTTYKINGCKAIRATCKARPGEGIKYYSKIEEIMQRLYLESKGMAIETYKTSYEEGTPQGLGTTIIFVPLK